MEITLSQGDRYAIIRDRFKRMSRSLDSDVPNSANWEELVESLHENLNSIASHLGELKEGHANANY